MKKKICMLGLLLSLGSIGMTVGANETTAIQNTEVIQDVEGRIADEIILKYRYLNGHLQCRRWNATQGYWVDPYWENVT